MWDTQELGRDFDVLGFAAPLVVVRRKSDGVRGSIVLPTFPTPLLWLFPRVTPGDRGLPWATAGAPGSSDTNYMGDEYNV